MNKKAKQIIDLEIDSKDKDSLSRNYYIAGALYVSAHGTRHFYEALSLYSDEYLEEFEELKNKHQH